MTAHDNPPHTHSLVRSLRRVLLPGLLITMLTFGAAACSSSSTSASDTNTKSVATLDHVDGTIVAKGATLTLTEKNGDSREFTLGPAVDQGGVKALELSGETTRVLFRPGKDVAVRVEPAPKPGAGAKSYTGYVSKVSDTSLTVDGDDGPLTFAILPADAEAMDVPHLKEHQKAKEGIRVYYQPTGADGQHAVAYEDAGDYRK